MSITSTPPRFVPTLTDVVAQSPNIYTAPASHAVPSVLSTFDDDQLIKRIMQRVDLVLERRLREAMGKVILEHTQELTPRLRVEIEGVVKEAIAQAVAQQPSPL